jgi:TolA-binding protein
MRWSTVSSPLLALCLAAGLVLPVDARQAGGKGAKRPTEKSPRNSGTPIDDFLHMTPEEQRQALDRLPPGQRMRLQQRLNKFNQLPPQQQQRLRTMYDRLNQLPPARQNLVRRSLNEFSQQPADRRQAMRQELRKLAPLGPKDREARMASPDFREKFSDKEQRIVSDMSDLLPDR